VNPFRRPADTTLDTLLILSNTDRIETPETCTNQLKRPRRFKRRRNLGFVQGNDLSTMSGIEQTFAPACVNSSVSLEE
jgi:hypothetical protein